MKNYYADNSSGTASPTRRCERTKVDTTTSPEKLPQKQKTPPENLRGEPNIFKKGFTLVEMLIVVVIIGILSAALLPRLQGAQSAARDSARKSDLSQLGSAILSYYNNRGEYPWPKTGEYKDKT